MTSQGTLPLFGPRPERELPLIYVATRLTYLGTDERIVVQGWCYVIQGVITTFTSEDPPWFARCHLPIKHSAPWIHDGRTSGQVYELNSELLWHEVDGLIVLTYKGGSLGAGHELATAAALGIPTLLTAHSSGPVSRHIEGFAAEHAITCETFTEPDRLRDVVDAWLRSERRRIEDNPRRRRSRAVRLARVAEHLEQEWNRLGPNGREEVQASAGICTTRIERILARPENLDAASVHELASLSSALGVDLERIGFGGALPDLDEMQRQALAVAADEYSWTGRTVLRLERAARAELAKPGIRRIRLTAVEDWLRLAEIHGVT